MMQISDMLDDRITLYINSNTRWLLYRMHSLRHNYFHYTTMIIFNRDLKAGNYFQTNTSMLCDCSTKRNKVLCVTAHSLGVTISSQDRTTFFYSLHKSLLPNATSSFYLWEQSSVWLQACVLLVMMFQALLIMVHDRWLALLVI